MLNYVLVFISAMLVDLVPFIGPPAWTAMVFFQMKYGLNIWGVLIVGVVGSTAGRYLYSMYIPLLSSKIIKIQKQQDIEFIGKKLAGAGWQIKLFVLLYTLLPLPSTPLFTAVGMAKIKPMHILPSFFVGKFASDMVMVIGGHYAASNALAISEGYLSWQNVVALVSGIVAIVVFLAIDWRTLLQQKEFRLNFKIWK